MFANWRNYVSAACLTAGAAVILPLSAGFAAESGAAPVLPYNTNFDQVAAPTEAAPKETVLAAPATPLVEFAEAAAPAEAIDKRELECMAKVVHHESRGQPRRGQVAVAQALVNRLNDGRFGDSICAVAAQRGQFFNIAAYHPRRDTHDWDLAEDVSREVLAGEHEQVAPGALFFRASYSSPDRFFRTRKPVATVGAHIFYR